MSITLVTTSTRPGVTNASSLVDAESTTGGEPASRVRATFFLEPWDVLHGNGMAVRSNHPGLPGRSWLLLSLTPKRRS